MKTKLIETSKARILCVDLPEHHNIEDLFISGLGYLCTYKKGREILHNEELPRNMEILGFLKELSEEQKEKVVDETDNPFWYGVGLKFIDFTRDDNCFATASESLSSLLKVNNIDEKANNFILIELNQ